MLSYNDWTQMSIEKLHHSLQTEIFLRFTPLFSISEDRGCMMEPRVYHVGPEAPLLSARLPLEDVVQLQVVSTVAACKRSCEK